MALVPVDSTYGAAIGVEHSSDRNRTDNHPRPPPSNPSPSSFDSSKPSQSPPIPSQSSNPSDRNHTDRNHSHHASEHSSARNHTDNLPLLPPSNPSSSSFSSSKPSQSFSNSSPKTTLGSSSLTSQPDRQVVQRYEIPEHLEDQIKKDILPKILRWPLSPSTYAEYFATLLYSEDFYLEAVLKMLNEIGSVENIPEFIEGVKNRKHKMSGFGHRVYKNYDPRAKVIRKLAEVFSIVGRDPLIEIDDEQFTKIMRCIKSGVDCGATLVTGGDRLGSKGYFIQPTVFADVKDDMMIAKEEIFRPVQSILKFSDLDEVIKRANSTRYALLQSVPLATGDIVGVELITDRFTRR